MVTGLTRFREVFADMTDCYVLIGGTACALTLSGMDIRFRATKDFDVVLTVEALDTAFFARFWAFIRAGRYADCRKADGERQFYRFRRPQEPDYPSIIELFSRHPFDDPAASGIHLTPIPAPEGCSSLSAILLDDDYYALIHRYARTVEGLSVASPEALIVLKAKAWMDLSTRKAAGQSIDGKDIRKHRNDIARLVQAVTEETVDLTDRQYGEMADFLAAYEAEPFDPRDFGVVLTRPEINALLRTLLCRP